MHLEVDGRQLEYRIAEPDGGKRSAGRTLVLLHEGLGSVSMWKDFPEALAGATGSRVLAYSRYGHGESTELGEPRSPDYMHREALDALPQVLSRLNIERPVLVGHSDGASIAIIHAGAGHRVEGLVLLAPHVFVEEQTLAGIALARDEFETTGMARKLARYHAHPQSMFRGWNDIWLDPAFRNWNIEHYLDSIRDPVLLLQSRDDPYGTLAQVDAIAHRVGGAAQKMLFAGTSHSPHVDFREETLAGITRFLGSLGPSHPKQ